MARNYRPLIGWADRRPGFRRIPWKVPNNCAASRRMDEGALKMQLWCWRRLKSSFLLDDRNQALFFSWSSRKIAWIRSQSVHHGVIWPHFHPLSSREGKSWTNVAMYWLCERFLSIWRMRNDDCVVLYNVRAGNLVSQAFSTRDILITKLSAFSNHFSCHRNWFRLMHYAKIVIRLTIVALWCWCWVFRWMKHATMLECSAASSPSGKSMGVLKTPKT